MKVLEEDKLKHQLNVAKTRVIESEKETDNKAPFSSNYYYWAGYVAALNFVLGVKE